ncbi:uncharacterized protein LOC129952311 [Eupeodes corollae]|uniref:uncharacterized protein LOC129952311 n=1 Tax=Eupeodes corollae TaxID=290404 RepID=UPI00248FD107|nr:uncharacterized protein LOC129952311 [Eupeodes corollae]
MANIFQSVLIFSAIAVTLCHAGPAKLDKIRTTRNRFLARQEVMADEDIPAQTPYPPAGIRPKVPFDLPTEERLAAPVNHYLPPSTDAAMFYSAPAEFYGPPAETYGPPEVNNEDGNGKSVTEGPEEETETETQTEDAQTVETVTEETDIVELPEEEKPATIDEDKADDAEASEDNFIPERLVLAKSKSAIKAAKLKQFAPLTHKTSRAQFYLINGSLYTVA